MSTAETQTAGQAGGGGLGLVLTGGGARGAYQAGVLRWIARRHPELRIPIMTGVSAGAVNIAKIASHHGTFGQAVDELTALWTHLTPEQIFHVDPGTLGFTAMRWGLRLFSGGMVRPPEVRGFLDTTPLRELLQEVLVSVDGRIAGIDYNIQRGVLRACAIVTTSYTTGQTVVFVKGRDVSPWSRPLRRTVLTDIDVEHVMASAAIPIFFPAVRIGNHWYGDGGIRLAAPLSPALHLGADRILAISTRYDRSQAESDTPSISGYPPPAQVLGLLMNAVFLDLVDQDVLRLQRLNQLLETLPPEKRAGLRTIGLLVIRPSRDLGKLAAEFEPQLPRAFRFMTRGLGTRETRSPDILSMIMFQHDYLTRLMEIGEADADARADDLEEFLAEDAVAVKQA
jgi:NTE family protein